MRIVVLGVLDLCEVGFFVADLNGVLTAADRGYCDMLGYDRDKVVGLSMKDATHPEDISSYERLIEQLVESNAPIVARKRSLRSNGTVVWVENRVSILGCAKEKSLLVASRAIAASVSSLRCARPAVPIPAEKCASYIQDLGAQLAGIADACQLEVTSSIIKLAVETSGLETKGALDVPGSSRWWLGEA